MQKNLKFSDTVYGFGAGIFFLGYFLFEVPSNLIMERAGARRWIARIMVTWGIISAAMMFVRSPGSFYGLRFLLGLAEAGFYPGILLYLTYWVPASLRAQVISRFLALSAILGLFGGPIGGALLKLDGWHGLTGWQWLFLLEGIPSVLMGFVVLRALPDSPNQAAWLTQREKDWLAARLARDAAEEKRLPHLTWGAALTDPRLLYLCLVFFLTAVAGNAVGFFGPQLVKARSGGVWSGFFRRDDSDRSGDRGGDLHVAGGGALRQDRAQAAARRGGLRGRGRGVLALRPDPDGAGRPARPLGGRARRADRGGIVLGRDD